MRSEGMIAPTPGTGCLFKRDLISQFTKELSFKKYYDRQQRAPPGGVFDTSTDFFVRSLQRRDVTHFVSALSRG
jgi:hypothetical protein